MRSRRIVPAYGLALAVTAAAVAGAQSPAFEVATIRLNTSGLVGGPGARRVGFDPGGFTMIDGSTTVLIYSAWPNATDIVGAPDWVSSDHFDVVAKADGSATLEQKTLMLRSLLADRFKLVAREEPRETPAYALVVDRSDGRLGPQLRRYEGNCAAAASTPDGRKELPPPSNGAPACGLTRSGRRIAAGGIPMGLLAGNLSGDAGREVVDRTGLEGAYELTIETTTDLGIFTALREQLGLKLEPVRVPLPVVIVEHIERPTPN